MKKKNELLIHIGTMKTGTTAIQRFLYENGEIVQNMGWCYPDLRSEIHGVNFEEIETTNDGKIWARYINARMLRLFFDGNKKLSDEKKDILWKELWEVLYEHLSKHNVILSDERLWWGSSEQLYKRIREQYDNIKIVVYLRRQDRYIESYWNQRVKRIPSYSDSFQDALENGKLNCSYLARLDMLSEIFGLDNIIVRCYEKGQFEGERKDVVSDFFSVLGVTPEWNKCISSAAENESLSGNYLEIKRNLNAVLTEGDPASEKLNDIFHEFCIDESHDKVTHVQGYFKPEQRKRFLEKASEENEIIAKKYLKREDGVMFYDINDSIPEYKIDESTMYGDIIKTLGAIVRDFQEQIITMRKELDDSIEALSNAGKKE